MERFIYLHGFASGPNSKKARIFHDRFAEKGIPLEIPDLTRNDFFHLTITSQLNVLAKLAAGNEVSLIGSSLGGYLAAIYAAQHPGEVRRVVLLAPAFGFARRWVETLAPQTVLDWQSSGRLTVPDYASGGTAEISWQLIEDGRLYDEEPDVRQPALIFHGTNDTVVPPEASRHFSASRPNVTLHLMRSGHELLDVVDDIWKLTEPHLLYSRE